MSLIEIKGAKPELLVAVHGLKLEIGNLEDLSARCTQTGAGTHRQVGPKLNAFINNTKAWGAIQKSDTMKIISLAIEHTDLMSYHFFVLHPKHEGQISNFNVP